MRYIVTGGGSGGHIYPLLSFISVVSEIDKDAEFLYVGKKGKMESQIVPAHGVDFVSIQSLGTKGKITWQNVKAAVLMSIGYVKSKQILRSFQPDFCIGAGGYVSVPLMKAAEGHGNIVSAVFESDQFIGRANLALAKRSDIIFSGLFDIKEKYFPTNKNYYQVGMPQSEELSKNLVIKDVEKKPTTVTFLGGSLGAEAINQQAILFAKSVTKGAYPSVKKINLVTGERYFEEIDALNQYDDILEIAPFVQDMENLYKKTDILVTRSGANIIGEAATYGIPMLLIPSPNVAHNHQYYNAKYFADLGAAVMLEEADISGDGQQVQELLSKLINNVDTRLSLQQAMIEFVPRDAATKMYEILQKVKKEKSN